MGKSNLGGEKGSEFPEGILLELKNKVQVLETSVKSCTKRLKEFHSQNRNSLLEHDKKIAKLAAKLKSVRVKLKEGKPKFKDLERKFEEGEEDGADSNQDELPELSAEAEDKENAIGTETPKFSKEKNKRNKSRRAEPAVEEGRRISHEAGAENEEPSGGENAEHKCRHCEGATFESRVDLEIHSRHLCPKTTGSHGCPACPEYFQELDFLLTHLKTHELESVETADGSVRDVEEEAETEENPKYQCRTCSTVFAHPRSFNRHLNLIHPQAAAYRCAECDLVFWSAQGLKQHEERASASGLHSKGTRLFKCSKCDYRTTRKDSRDRHMRTCHILSFNNRRKFKCFQCTSTYLSQAALRVHARQKHAGLFRQKCSVCSKGLVMGSFLKRHEKLHLRSSAYQCSQCKNNLPKPLGSLERGKTCGSSSSLSAPSPISDLNSTLETEPTKEVPKVSGENASIDDTPRIFKLKTFSTKYVRGSSKQPSKIKRKALKSRKSLDGASLPISPTKLLFTCKTCRKEFAYKHSLTRHEKTHKKFLLVTAQKYGCKFCKEAFSTWFDFTEHVKTHSESHGVTKTLPPLSRGKPGLKKWKCLHCDKEFSGPETMQSHFIYTHAWRKPHECKNCQRSFCSSDGLKRHSKAHEDFQDPDYQEDEDE